MGRLRQVGATGRDPSKAQPLALTTVCLDTTALRSTRCDGPCPEVVEQWISLLACWADTFLARQRKIALLNHLRHYLDFIILRIGPHESSVHFACLLTLCAFAISYANQSQVFIAIQPEAS